LNKSKMITSKDNPKIKRVRALQADSKIRRAEQAFVVEGIRLVEEALASCWGIQWVIHTNELGERGQRLLHSFLERGVLVEQVTPLVMESASETQTPQGLLAVVEARSLPLPDAPDFIFIPDGVHDPGNLGTMLRTAAAAGVQGALLPPGSVDPFSPKVLRSATGAHFRLPIQSSSWEEINALVLKEELKVYLAEAGGGDVYTEVDWRAPLALVIGGEAAGASQEARRLASRLVFIPMPGGGESLNAAAASAILFFEAVRQRRRNDQQSNKEISNGPTIT
jgi:RNA methyltransferase, TrmH family